MDSVSEAKQPPSANISLIEPGIERMQMAFDKATQLLQRHLAAGQQTVPARALFFILRDAGYGTSARRQEVEPDRQTPKQTQEPTNQLHHNYGMRR